MPAFCPLTVCARVGLLSLIALASWSAPAVAQESRMSVVIDSADRTLKDAKALVEQSRQPDQWPNLYDYLDDVLLGADRTRPIRYDAVMHEGELVYLHYYPVEDEEEFLKNVQAFGVSTRRLFTRGQYRLGQNYEGYLQFGEDYARIVPDRSLISRGAPTLGDPTQAIAKLTALQVDAAAEIVNASADGADERSAAFAAWGDEQVAALERKEGETALDLELRKTVLAALVLEAARLYGESDRSQLTVDRDDQTNTLASDLDVSALPGTTLQAAIDAMGTVPGYFYSVKQPVNVPLSLRTRHPLDAMRKRNLTKIADVVKRSVVEYIDDEDGLKASEKDAARKANDILFKLLQDTIDTGLLDGMIDVIPVAGEQHAALIGMLVPDATRAEQVLDLMPQIDPGVTIERKVDAVGDVAIHKITLPEKGPVRDYFESFWADDGIIYVGITSDKLFGSAGPDALDRLKALIAQSAADGGDAKQVLNLALKPGPFVARRVRRNVPTSYPKTRQAAFEAFQKGNDLVTASFRREGDDFVGQVRMDTGLSTFLGSMIAQFTEENLSE